MIKYDDLGVVMMKSKEYRIIEICYENKIDSILISPMGDAFISKLFEANAKYIDKHKNDKYIFDRIHIYVFYYDRIYEVANKSGDLYSTKVKFDNTHVFIYEPYRTLSTCMLRKYGIIAWYEELYRKTLPWYKKIFRKKVTIE